MITGYVGLIGQGKTMLAADDAIATARRRGALLASNIKLRPGPDVEFVPLLISDDGLDLGQLDTLVQRCRRESRGLVLLIDEVGIIMPARFWQSFPIGLMFVLSQSRKLSLDLIWTSQDVEQVDAFLRRLTQWVYKIKAFPTPSLERRERGKRPWFMTKTTFRPAHVTAAANDKRIKRETVWYRREREELYDTDELVMPPLNLGRRSRSKSGDFPPSMRQEVLPNHPPAAHAAPPLSPDHDNGPPGNRPGPVPGLQETDAGFSDLSPARAQARVRSDPASGGVDRSEVPVGSPAV